jgi:hypothetical protein
MFGSGEDFVALSRFVLVVMDSVDFVALSPFVLALMDSVDFSIYLSP